MFRTVSGEIARVVAQIARAAFVGSHARRRNLSKKGFAELPKYGTAVEVTLTLVQADDAIATTLHGIGID